MINKRLLIKSLLSKNDENSFYDKKQKLSLQSRESKAKFIKHVCALSNSNPDNNSYIVIGVEDEENKIVGVDFFDDSKIQNLVNAYLINPPKISYENVHFPRLPRYKVVGLVTIYPNKEITSLSKTAWKYPKKTIFYRIGSNSIPFEGNFILKNTNKPIVRAIEKHAGNNIELTLNGVFDFFNRHKKEYNPQYKVFSEQFVLCWAGKKSKFNGEEYYSRVDIELINEQVRLFYSNLDDVKISYNENSFIITEYILLGIDKEHKHYPLEKTVIHFKENGIHDIATEFLFESPKFNKKVLYHIYNNNNAIISKIEKEIPLSVSEHEDVLKLPTSYLICYLNGFLEAEENLKKAKKYIRSLEDKKTYIEFKEVLRVLRKVKYK
ncbi:Putative DNA-binding domain-containing protein [Tenacibaculum sp. MAR_2009_124]|uniref:ATP-binding protein n=1 Tax=Tenacibaculum sp. MAR_2009_124 TaxID=1250059 RepID=UPI000899C0B5|nr:ATP-binding protein [Tenacibaculum sp. MAR_2009_124]SEC53701.1 Putative DNA-binding domain-containing protein [Tenacibaculum sp. MAR_2009_124]